MSRKTVIELGAGRTLTSTEEAEDARRADEGLQQDRQAAVTRFVQVRNGLIA